MTKFSYKKMQNLSVFYHSLTQNQKRVFRDVMDVELGWGRSTFYYKQNHCNFSLLEARALEKILSDFLDNFANYRQLVIDRIKDGYELQRVSVPRKDQKRTNNIISKVYENVCKNECTSQACQ
ncbi:MAG: hypothetical protein MJZ82_01975 [Paludibacteraceae bacterium]|nr:hypothetical protein [Paludibacteraceae bacterium]